MTELYESAIDPQALLASSAGRLVLDILEVIYADDLPLIVDDDGNIVNFKYSRNTIAPTMPQGHNFLTSLVSL